MTIRERSEQLEREHLSPHAAYSADSRGRAVAEQPDPVRTCYQRDRDRIIHQCRAFRRLAHKTQVFIAPHEDHLRTRLSHTLEVSQIGRTIAKALRLNEELTEAIALGHDVGHTPFGHAGERALDEAVRAYDPAGGFNHYEHSLRVVDELERDGSGLNLTYETRMGIVHHSKGEADLAEVLGEKADTVGRGPVPRRRDSSALQDGSGGAQAPALQDGSGGAQVPALQDGSGGAQVPALQDGTQAPKLTLEAMVIRVADRIAYLNHDLDDCLRVGVLSQDDLPSEVLRVLGYRHSQRVGRMVTDVIDCSLEQPRIAMSPEVLAATDLLRGFMFERVYFRPELMDEVRKVQGIVGGLFEVYMGGGSPPRDDTALFEATGNVPDDQPRRLRLVTDYIAGMTDRYARAQYVKHFLPSGYPF
jgi:dGTPase